MRLLIYCAKALTLGCGNEPPHWKRGSFRNFFPDSVVLEINPVEMRYHLITLAFLLVPQLLFSQGRADRIIDSLDRDLTEVAKRDEVVGFGVALVNGVGVQFAKGYGYADLAAKRPYTANTIQNIGSVSKTFIGTALQRAVKAGVLRWDDPINKYLPFEVVHPRHQDQPILLHHLASHTAGIKDGKQYELAYTLNEPLTLEKGSVKGREYRTAKKYAENKKMSLEEFCRAFLTPDGVYYKKKNFQKTAPGAKYAYSNVGAALAALVLQRAAKTPFEDYTRRYIFNAIGMENTGWRASSVNLKTHIQHYFSNRQPMPKYALNTFPDGGLMTSVTDLGIYLSATIAGLNRGSDLLSKRDYAALLERSVEIEAGGDRYGGFWEMTDSGFIGHTGGDPGIVTVMYLEKKTGWGQIVFFNGEAKDNDFYQEVFLKLLATSRKLTKN
jgi:CubicO group peptidase (beta-lactamase class C family)